MRRLITLTAALLALLAVASSSASAAGEQWINGNTSYSYGNSCIILGQPSYTQQVGSYTGYWGKTDTSYPKIGDRFWGHVYYMPTGLGCAFGVHGVQVEIALPSGTSLAIKPGSSDPQDKIQCFGTMTNGQVVNLTDQTWTNPNNTSMKGKYCQPTVTSQGGNGTVLSYALLGQGQGLDIVFPLVATKKLSGIAEPGQASRMTATVTDSASTGAIQPYQWNFVGDRPIEPDCPGAGPTAASGITNTTAHTRNYMCNWYRSGKVSMEMGEGASGAYQTSSPQENVGAGDQAIYVDQDWNGLTPGTVYHWRLKFVDDKGTATTGDDSTYYSPDRTFTTSGTRPTTPPPSNPGPGSGGTGTGDPGTTPGTGGTGTNPGDTGAGSQGGDLSGQQQAEQTQQVQQQQTQQIQHQEQRQEPRDTTAPALGATLGKLKLGDVLKKGLPATLTCNEGCRVDAQLQVDAKTAKKLKLGKATTIGTASATAAGGGQVPVSVKLNARAKKALKTGKSLKATLVVTATDAAGNHSAPVTKAVTLKR